MSVEKSRESHREEDTAGGSDASAIVGAGRGSVVRVDRIRRDIESIAACTATPGAGVSRPTFSDSWRAAVDYVAGELPHCDVRIDAAGNFHARPADLSWDTPAWLCGSHLDSVPHGGDFDGVTGVVVPLELFRTARETGAALPLELVVFAEEEGTTFGRGMLGSLAWAGRLSAGDLGRLANSDGESYLEAGRPHGVRRDHIGKEVLRAETIKGFIEVHPEQGPRLWQRGAAVAVVTAIAGRRQMQVRITGQANHAGSTAMPDRQDALAGAADILLQLERLAGDLSPQTVITVGQLRCAPNAVNVIPGEAIFTIDFRSPDDAVLDAGAGRIESLVLETATRRGLRFVLETTESLAAMDLDQALCSRLREAAARCGFGTLPETVSGALHDAAILAPHVPTAMLFVASRDGVSHNPAEFSRVEDIAVAAQILWEMILGPA